jgi:beta-lactamase regulating signal transducer with metallopeptidase domain
MNDLLQALVNTANDGARFLFLWSWQVALLLAVVYLVIRLSQFRAAATRYQVWVVALIAIALLPVCTKVVQNTIDPKTPGTPIYYLIDVPASLTALPSAQQTTGSNRSATTAAFSFRQSDLWALLFLVWAMGFLLSAKQLLGSYRRSRTRRLQAQAVSLSELECAELENRLVASSLKEIKLAESIASPLLVGLLHPTILLPADICQWTTAEERKTILLHEMIHAQRRDHWANYFQSFVRALFFFHPLVRYAANQLSIERELSCDETVLFLGAKASSYAESILKVAEKSVAADVLDQPAFITKKMLERRIEMILQGDRLKWSASRWTLLILPVALIAVMLWVLVPGRSASAGSSQESSGELQERERRQKVERDNQEREREAREKRGYAWKIQSPESERELQEHREMEIKQALQGAEILAQVSELRVMAGKRHEAADNLVDVSAAETVKIGEEMKLSNVVVKTPEFTFKAEHATGQNGILNIIGNPIEIESRGRVYYSYNSIAIANRSGTVMYVISKHAKLYTEKNQQSDSVEFGKLLRESN